MHLSSFHVAAAASAADAVRTDDTARYEVVTVFVTVTFQVALRPPRHGTEVKSSGLILSDLANPLGLLTEETPALVIARQTRPLVTCGCARMRSRVSSGFQLSRVAASRVIV